ncbi:small-subunit processome [Lipomyces kononenkoae]|uniref:Small-subunit processome n=1 Tax=Lipomyces kononenkoae TaxID=34357 RepID=A0ACC3T8M9_LIPKO
MSSLKFSVQKQQHRERAQPHARRKWGLLEKHKDYVLRARDYHAKEARIKTLREKVQSRNPDEFYHAMVSSKTDARGIKKQDRQTSVVLSLDEVKLLKTQDEGYLITLITQEKAKISRLQDRLAFIKDESVESELAKPSEDPSDLDYSDLDSDGDENRKRKPKKRLQSGKKSSNTTGKHLVFADTLEDALAHDGSLPSGAPELNSELSRMHKLLIRELADRKQRVQQLEKVLQEVQLQRQLMTNGPKKKIVKSDGSVTWKWKPQRKR